MALSRSLSVFFLLLLLNIPAWCQQVSRSWKPINVNTDPPVVVPAQKDDKAVQILNSSVAIAGGATAIKATTDYTAVGQITYPSSPDAKNPVTIKGRQLRLIRIDASLPTGTRTWAVSDGQNTTKKENGQILRQVPGGMPLPTSETFPYKTPMFAGALAFPYSQIVAVINDTSFSVSLKGTSKLGDHSVYDVQVEREIPTNEKVKNPKNYLNRRDFYIDTSSFQLLMTEDVVPKNTIHRLHYGDYRVANGSLVPFSIAEELGGQSTWTITLNDISFNSGLTDASFEIQ